MSFDSIPILDLALATDPATKPAFLNDLKHALLEVGFLYIKNVPRIDDALVNRVKQLGIDFFTLPEEVKLQCEMKRAKSFLGYNKLGTEITRFKTDWREQIDLSTRHPVPGPEEPLYRNLLAPNLWPDPQALPGFQETYEEYMTKMGKMSVWFTSLCAEAIGLPADAFDKFFDGDAQQHKLKIVKYPDLEELGVEGEAQGVGPHKDSMLTSYLLQASHHRGLQVQNGDGKVSAKAQLTEYKAHREEVVLDIASPFFQGVSYDATFESMEVPDHVKQLRQDILARRGGRLDDIEFTFVKGMWSRLGEATLMNRIKSHPDVSEIWYPDLLKQITAQNAQQVSAA